MTYRNLKSQPLVIKRYVPKPPKPISIWRKIFEGAIFGLIGVIWVAIIWSSIVWIAG